MRTFRWMWSGFAHNYMWAHKLIVQQVFWFLKSFIHYHLFLLTGTLALVEHLIYLVQALCPYNSVQYDIFLDLFQPNIPIMRYRDENTSKILLYKWIESQYDLFYIFLWRSVAPSWEWVWNICLLSEFQWRIHNDCARLLKRDQLRTTWWSF